VPFAWLFVRTLSPGRMARPGEAGGVLFPDVHRIGSSDATRAAAPDGGSTISAGFVRPEGKRSRSNDPIGIAFCLTTFSCSYFSSPCRSTIFIRRHSCSFVISWRRLSSPIKSLQNSSNSSWFIIYAKGFAFLKSSISSFVRLLSKPTFFL